MARKSSRKLFLFGRYSLALLLPKKWLRDLGVERGQSISLEYDRARKRIVLRFSVTDLQPNPKSPKRTTKPNANSESGELEPIPEI